MQIDITIPDISDSRLQFKLTVSRPLRKYFIRDTSYVQYDKNLDIKNIDSSILAIPMAAVVAPIAWAVGAKVNIPRLDAAYLQSLDRVKHIFQGSRSNFSFSGDIYTEEVVTNRFQGKKTGMLFSGGVDSLTSYLRHRYSSPDLFSIWGVPDIPPSENEFWSRMWTDISDLADRDGLRALQIKTDAFRNINRELLGREFGLNWWGDVASGLFLLGMCAPLTAMREIGTVIIASSYDRDFQEITGFHPSIYKNVSWAQVSVLHDGNELSRQQKMHYLCNKENIRYLSKLRVCWDSAWRTNCSNCEKCLRTITGLVVEGADPNSCNFEINSKTFSRLKDCFTKGKMRLSAGQLYFWADIQKHLANQIDTDISGSREFLNWFKEYDLTQYRMKRLRHLVWMTRLLYSNRRIKAASIVRKIKCYYYIVLAKLKLL
jgi:hypothetical protein